mmetsp:Transcript_36243/g.85986  ORF Transcript_36243/g.85986 Transcript_36243/m.85986 type:complete len:309 (-) Transcript_36243:1113-2039(-)
MHEAAPLRAEPFALRDRLEVTLAGLPQAAHVVLKLALVADDDRTVVKPVPREIGLIADAAAAKDLCAVVQLILRDAATVPQRRELLPPRAVRLTHGCVVHVVGHPCGNLLQALPARGEDVVIGRPPAAPPGMSLKLGRADDRVAVVASDPGDVGRVDDDRPGDDGLLARAHVCHDVAVAKLRTRTGKEEPPVLREVPVRGARASPWGRWRPHLDPARAARLLQGNLRRRRVAPWRLLPGSDALRRSSREVEAPADRRESPRRPGRRVVVHGAKALLSRVRRRCEPETEISKRDPCLWQEYQVHALAHL